MTARCDDNQNSVYVPDFGETIICPKPHRAGNDFWDIIHSMGGYGLKQSCTNVASSPPLFCGLPPSRVANPLIHDARFGEDTSSPLSQLSPIPPPSGLSSSPSRKGGSVRANFGNKPAVRIEGSIALTGIAEIAAFLHWLRVRAQPILST